jgi:HK97 family phage major capsid protein
MRSINMQTNVMKIPLNPEAGYATWMANSSFNSAASAGATQTHSLTEITLSAYKVATNEYVGYEEEEDSLLVILPIVRDAMIRRTAKSVDKAFLVGAGAGADPVKGLAAYDATSVVTISAATGYSTTATAKLRDLRKDLGAMGLDPSDVVFLVNTETYYGLLEDTTFQTMDKVGDKASILTGQVGMVAGSPVLVSAELPANTVGSTSALTNISALAVAKSNWLVGNQRGLRFDVQDLAETQRKVLVASLRTGLTQLTTNLGQGVSALRWVA